MDNFKKKLERVTRSIEKRTAGQPRHGKEIKKVYSVRIEPKVYEKITAKFGKFSDFLDSAIKQLL